MFQNQSNTQQTFEKSDDLLHYIENNPSLRGFIEAKYFNIFDLEYKYYKAEKEMNTIIKSAKRDADYLKTEIEQENQPNLVLNLQKSNINSVLIQALESLENESDNSSESSDIEKDQDSLSITSETSELQEIIDIMITKSKLGSNLFVSTNIFLELIISQPCSACFNTDIATKKYQITACGFSVKINITYNKCSTTMFYKNETAGIDYSKLVTGAAHNKHLLEVSFNNSWSYIREASQASSKFIYNGNIEETITINEGNYNNSSKQIEHANLIRSIAKITPTLIKYNIVLGVAVDGDLNSNKTLADQPIVSKIFADLKHK
ncbi:9712_t:CDS:2, partial [Racocetra fulgida]